MVCRPTNTCPPAPSQIPLQMLETLQTLCETMQAVLAGLGGTADGDIYVLGKLYKVQWIPFDIADASTGPTVAAGALFLPVSGVRPRVVGLRASAENDVNVEFVAAPSSNTPIDAATNVSGVAFYSARGGEDYDGERIGAFVGLPSQGLYLRTDAAVRVSGCVALVAEEV
jgi:hypothetical protein